MYSSQRVKDVSKTTEGFSDWFSYHLDRLISIWVAAGEQISDDHTVQKKMLITLWAKVREDVLQLL